ncbi:MAG: hypothetical protein KAH77_01935 [Thiomargarita sp.]|nr:hypothetical protein [Thiomargarita sp.]
MAKIGFSQLLKREWLDFTVQRTLEQLPVSTAKLSMDTFLSDKVAVGVTTRNHTRKKTITILSKIWLKPSKIHNSFRKEGLALFELMPEHTHVALHWGMTMVAYPFFGVVAEHVGRLLRLQDEVTLIQVQNRIREQWGERETVKRGIRKIMLSWVDWGLLLETNKRWIYTAPAVQSVSHTRLTSWLLESALIASNGDTAVLRHLMNYTPALFPFHLTNSYFIPNERLDTFNQGVDDVSVTFNQYHKR